MPTYRYRCSDCGNEFDQFQKFAEEPLKVCPSCEGAIRRVIQPVGVVFKGSGWYINDSRPSSNSTNGKDAKVDKVETASKSEAAETKSGTPEAPVSKQSDSKASSESSATKAAATT
jgi:putative FmdB family regulatory protein